MDGHRLSVYSASEIYQAFREVMLGRIPVEFITEGIIPLDPVERERNVRMAFEMFLIVMNRNRKLKSGEKNDGKYKEEGSSS